MAGSKRGSNNKEYAAKLSLVAPWYRRKTISAFLQSIGGKHVSKQHFAEARRIALHHVGLQHLAQQEEQSTKRRDEAAAEEARLALRLPARRPAAAEAVRGSRSVPSECAHVRTFHPLSALFCSLACCSPDKHAQLEAAVGNLKGVMLLPCRKVFVMVFDNQTSGRLTVRSVNDVGTRETVANGSIQRLLRVLRQKTANFEVRRFLPRTVTRSTDALLCFSYSLLSMLSVTKWRANGASRTATSC